MIESWLDFALGGMLVAAATGAIFSRTLTSSVCLFVAFGLLLAIAWVRLDAVDLALAEAAIGAGLTGFLLFRALIHGEEEPAVRIKAHAWCAGGLLMVVLAAVLLPTLPWSETTTTVAPEGPSLPLLARQQLGASGVDHPVTAVLLNFRAWDTLLELAVLLVAFLATRHLQPRVQLTNAEAWPLPQAWSRFLAPLLLVTGGYLLWQGTQGPGGAFQAGTLWAAGAVILRLNGLLPCLRWSRFWIRLLLVAGLGLFTIVAAMGAIGGQGWLHYPPGYSATAILAIETAATVSIAATLTLLVAGEPEDLQT